MSLRDCWLCVLILCVTGTATFQGNTAGVPSAALDQMVNNYLARTPLQIQPTNLSMAAAYKTQAQFIKGLSPTLGRKVGYKVALVTREAQAKYGIQTPLRGVLLSKMLFKNAAVLPAKFGVQPLCEADLMVVVKSRRINKAKTPMEALEHLEDVVAFIELPDNYISTNQPVNAATLTAANVGARYGVLGTRAPVKATPSFLKGLADMKITMTDQNGVVLGMASGKTILDQPIHALLWLIEELNRSGTKLKAGDMISLGGVLQVTPQPGQNITVTYTGLPGGTLRALVRFD